MTNEIAGGANIRRQSRGAFYQRVEDNAFHLARRRTEESLRRLFYPLLTDADAAWDEPLAADSAWAWEWGAEV